MELFQKLRGPSWDSKDTLNLMSPAFTPEGKNSILGYNNFFSS